MAESFDYKPPRTGPDPILVAISAIMVVVLGIAGFMAYSTTKAKREKEDLERQLAGLTEQIKIKDDEVKAVKSDMEALVADYEAKVERINKEWNERFTLSQQDSEKRLQKSFETITQIVNESGVTMDYMKQLESKMKTGKELQQSEIEDLKAVATGLAYLHKQYEKPIHEFRELDAYLAKQLQVQAVPPDQRMKFFKSMFSKDYRDQMSQYYQDIGRRTAIENTREQVAVAYQRAQQEMSSIRVNTEQYLASLDTVIGAKQENLGAIDSFFEVSQEILKIHQRVMSVDLQDVATQTPETIRP